MMRWGKCLVLALVVVLAVGAHVNAKDAVTFGQTTTAKVNPNTTTIEVPLFISNSDNLAAIDVPLKFGNAGDGIELINVDLDNGRAHYFDVKVADIDNDNKTVKIGLLWMAYNGDQMELAAGDGRLATLTFEITDPTMEEFTIAATSFENPGRELGFIYCDDTDGKLNIYQLRPEFEPLTIPVMAKTPVIPAEWSLSQNYPNPFNASTMISFGLPADAHVRLDVYNILGQRVTTLRDELLPAGLYNVTWNADQVASGVYFYRLQTDEFTQTRKMTLMK